MKYSHWHTSLTHLLHAMWHTDTLKTKAYWSDATTWLKSNQTTVCRYQIKMSNRAPHQYGWNTFMFNHSTQSAPDFFFCSLFSFLSEIIFFSFPLVLCLKWQHLCMGLRFPWLRQNSIFIGKNFTTTTLHRFRKHRVFSFSSSPFDLQPQVRAHFYTA